MSSLSMPLQIAIQKDILTFEKSLETYTHLSSDDRLHLLGFLNRMKALVQDPLCVDRSRPLGHFTASAFILNPMGQPLALLHKKLQRWLQPGGHLESQDQSPLQAALREAKEESQLTLIPLSHFPVEKTAPED